MTLRHPRSPKPRTQSGASAMVSSIATASFGLGSATLELRSNQRGASLAEYAVGLLLCIVITALTSFVGLGRGLRSSGVLITCRLEQLLEPELRCQGDEAEPPAGGDPFPLILQGALDETSLPLTPLTVSDGKVWARENTNELPRPFDVPNGMSRDALETRLAQRGLEVITDPSLIAAARVVQPGAVYSSEDEEPTTKALAALLEPHGSVQLANADGVDGVFGDVNADEANSDSFLERVRNTGVLSYPQGTSWGRKSLYGLGDGIAAFFANTILLPWDLADRMEVAFEVSKRVTDDPTLQALLAHGLLVNGWVAESDARRDAIISWAADCGDAYLGIVVESRGAGRTPYTCHRGVGLMLPPAGALLGPWARASSAASGGPPSAGGVLGPIQKIPKRQAPARRNQDEPSPDTPSDDRAKAGEGAAVVGASGATPDEEDNIDPLESSLFDLDRQRTRIVYRGDALLTRALSTTKSQPTWRLHPPNRAWWAEIHRDVANALRTVPELAHDDLIPEVTVNPTTQELSRPFPGKRGLEVANQLSEAQLAQARPLIAAVVEQARTALEADAETGIVFWDGDWEVQVVGAEDQFLDRFWVELDDSGNVARVVSADMIKVTPPSRLIESPRYPPPRSPALNQARQALVPAGDFIRAERDGDEVLRTFLDPDEAAKIVELTNDIRQDPELANVIPEMRLDPDDPNTIRFDFPTEVEELLDARNLEGSAVIYSLVRISDLIARAENQMETLGDKARGFRIVADKNRMGFTSWGEPIWWPFAVHPDPDAEPPDGQSRQNPDGPRLNSVSESGDLDDGSVISPAGDRVNRTFEATREAEAVLETHQRLVALLRAERERIGPQVIVPELEPHPTVDGALTYPQPQHDPSEKRISLTALGKRNPFARAAVDKQLAVFEKNLRTDLGFDENNVGHASNGLPVRFVLDPDRVFVSEDNLHSLLWLDPVRAGERPRDSDLSSSPIIDANDELLCNEQTEDLGGGVARTTRRAPNGQGGWSCETVYVAEGREWPTEMFARAEPEHDEQQRLKQKVAPWFWRGAVRYRNVSVEAWRDLLSHGTEEERAAFIDALYANIDRLSAFSLATGIRFDEAMIDGFRRTGSYPDGWEETFALWLRTQPAKAIERDRLIALVSEIAKTLPLPGVLEQLRTIAMPDLDGLVEIPSGPTTGSTAEEFLHVLRLNQPIDEMPVTLPLLAQGEFEQQLSTPEAERLLGASGASFLMGLSPTTPLFVNLWTNESIPQAVPALMRASDIAWASSDPSLGRIEIEDIARADVETIRLIMENEDPMLNNPVAFDRLEDIVDRTDYEDTERSHLQTLEATLDGRRVFVKIVDVLPDDPDAFVKSANSLRAASALNTPGHRITPYFVATTRATLPIGGEIRDVNGFITEWLDVPAPDQHRDPGQLADDVARASRRTLSARLYHIDEQGMEAVNDNGEVHWFMTDADSMALQSHGLIEYREIHQAHREFRKEEARYRKLAGD